MYQQSAAEHVPECGLAKGQNSEKRNAWGVSYGHARGGGLSFGVVGRYPALHPIVKVEGAFLESKIEQHQKTIAGLKREIMEVSDAESRRRSQFLVDRSKLEDHSDSLEEQVCETDG